MYTEAQLRAKKKYYAENRERVIRESVARTKRITDERKELLSQYSCICCGCNDPDLIQWHHVDETQKSHTVFSGGFGVEKFWDEVLKCVPVCANCHIKIHKGKLCLIHQPKPTR